MTIGIGYTRTPLTDLIVLLLSIPEIIGRVIWIQSIKKKTAYGLNRDRTVISREIDASQRGQEPWNTKPRDFQCCGKHYQAEKT